jgi:L-cysteine desulfidase
MHASSVSTAILSAMLGIQDECVTSVEGIIDNDVDNSFYNFTPIGKDAMDETDKYVLDIMVKK